MVTRWSPDTCDCVVEYDDSLNLTTVVNRCSIHQNVGTDATVFNTLKEENPRKNISMKEILDNAPTSVFDIDAISGERVFKRGITVDFAFSGTPPDRALTLTINGITLTTPQMNAIKTKLDTRFGIGKVVFVQG